VATLESVGLSASFYALLHLGVEVFNVVIVNLFCIYYLRHLITHWMGYVTCLMFVQYLLMPNVIWAYFEAFPSLDIIGESLITIGMFSFFWLLFTFPRGYFVPRWSVLPFLLGVTFIFINSTTDYYDDFTGTEFSATVLSPFMFALVSGALLQIYRYVRIYTPVEREQTRWVVFSFPLMILGFIGWGVGIEYLAFEPGMPRVWINIFSMPIIMVLSVVPLTVALTLAIVEEKLWNIDMVINRTLVYVMVTVIILVTYVFVIALLSLVFGGENNFLISVVATGAVALIFQVVRQSVQRGVNRLMFGQRDEPQAVLMHLSEQLQSAMMPEDLLRVSAETIGKSLRIPYVAITLRHGDEVLTQAQYGSNGTPTRAIELVHRDEAVGELIVGRRSPGETLNNADRTVLSSVAQQLGAIVYAVRLQSDLRNARERLVVAREEERRRLRRDLHDGLGPALASLPLKIDAAIDLIVDDQQTSMKLLSDVKREAQQLVTDVRRVVNDLRPPVLDELGLVVALQGAISRTAHPNSMSVRFQAESVPERIPAAAEAAAYHITMEAVTNVIKHARADHCWVKLFFVSHPPGLHITVEDDGVGMPQPVTPNVGLQSMRERAEELGGAFAIQPREAGGNCLYVTIPIPEES